MNTTNYTIPVEGSLGLLAMGAVGLKAWRNVKQGKQVQISSKKQNSSGTGKRKVLLIGWDSADWQIINPLLDKGLMPALEKLIGKGVMGNLATLDPPISPMLWTSIATGKAPEKHGVLGFIEPDAQTGKIRPVTSTTRKVKAIWNILTQKGYKTHTVGWWPSFPAEPINGICVSNSFAEIEGGADAPWTLKRDVVYPEELNSLLAELRIHPQEITQAHILPFIPHANKIDQSKDKAIQILAKEIASCSSYHAAATHIMENEEWDFMAVYLDTIDHICHSFMKFHPPQLPGVPDDYFAMYNQVVSGMYIYHDMMLERLMTLAGDDATVMLISDHGFYNDHLRVTKLPKYYAAPILEHRQYGIFCMKGPGIVTDERVYGASVIDITPTILQLFDLPVGKDMEGKVLSQTFVQPTGVSYIPSWETVEGNCGMHPKDKIADPFESAEAMKQLIELGYISPLEENDKKNLDNATAETQFSLARSHVYFQKYDRAISILEKLYEQYPERVHFALKLASCYELLGNPAKAREIIAILRKDPKNQMPQLDLLEGSLLLAENKPRKALEHFKKAEEFSTQSPQLFLKTGQVYLRTRQWLLAEQAYLKALEKDPDNALAYLGLSISYLKQNKLEDAVNEALNAVGLLHELTQGHYYLGEALFKIGEYEKAIQAFSIALSQAPGMKKAHEWLIKIYENYLINKDLAQKHRAFIKDKIKGTIYVVSGLPRSGTSMLMQMLHAGGMILLTDNVRQNDINNPKGYFEYEKVKSIHKDNSWLHEGIDKCVKIVTPLVHTLPSNYNYKIIFVHRDISEVLTSQQIMLGKKGSDYPLALEQAYKKYIEQTFTWMNANPNVSFIEINYHDIVSNTLEQVENIASFLNADLDLESMVNVVDADLYRNRNVTLSQKMEEKV